MAPCLQAATKKRLRDWDYLCGTSIPMYIWTLAGEVTKYVVNGVLRSHCCVPFSGVVWVRQVWEGG